MLAAPPNDAAELISRKTLTRVLHEYFVSIYILNKKKKQPNNRPTKVSSDVFGLNTICSSTTPANLTS